MYSYWVFHTNYVIIFELLSMVKIILVNSYELKKLKLLFFYYFYSEAKVYIFFVWHSRIVATVQLKKCEIDIRVLSMLIAELNNL